MKKEWYTATEIAKLATKFALNNFPKTSRGVNKRAISGGWKKRTRTSGQGGGYEFHHSSLPIDMQEKLGFVKYDWVDETHEMVEKMYQHNCELEEYEYHVENFLKKAEEYDIEIIRDAALNDLINTGNAYGFTLENLSIEEKEIIDRFREVEIEDKAMLTKLILILMDANKEKIDLIKMMAKMPLYEISATMSFIKNLRKYIKQASSEVK